MGQIVLFAAAFVVLVAVIYGALSHRSRRRVEAVTGPHSLERDGAGASVDSLIDRPPTAQRVAEPNGVEPDFSEDDIQREMFGPRGVKGAPDPARMTPQRAKKTPTHIDQGHVS
jgi:hypothetical protein